MIIYVKSIKRSLTGFFKWIIVLLLGELSHRKEVLQKIKNIEEDLYKITRQLIELLDKNELYALRLGRHGAEQEDDLDVREKVRGVPIQSPNERRIAIYQ